MVGSEARPRTSHGQSKLDATHQAHFSRETVEDGRLGGTPAMDVDETVRSLIIEPDHTISQCLPVHPADLG